MHSSEQHTAQPLVAAAATVTTLLVATLATVASAAVAGLLEALLATVAAYKRQTRELSACYMLLGLRDTATLR